FASTSKLILGNELRPIKKYEKFLTRYIDKVTTRRSPFGNDVSYGRYFWAANAPKERIVTSVEGAETGKVHIKPEDAEGLDLEKIIQLLPRIAYYSVQFEEGENINLIETLHKYSSSNTYQVGDATFSKKCAYCTHVQNCDNVFGSGVLIVGSTYSIRCYDCVNVTMCMDLDSCKNCHRCMFCHNCEGLSDCMFCFNAKSLHYAIGNVEVGKEQYEKVKKMVLGELVKRIEKDGDIGFDICSLGSEK
ncbi:MAG: hypothetical protein V1909_02930, partial [Candidatus Micrarchaeota archaeon]